MYQIRGALNVPTSGFVSNAPSVHTDSIRLSKQVVHIHACYTHQLLSIFHQTNEDRFSQSIPRHPNQSKRSPIPHAMPLPSARLAHLFPRPAPCATGLRSEKGKEFVTFPNKTLARQKNIAINHLTFQYCITL